MTKAIKKTVVAILLLCTAISFACFSACGEKECKHEYGEWKITTAATCTEDGVRTRVCSKCNDTETERVLATGHKGDVKCSVCGEILVDDFNQSKDKLFGEIGKNEGIKVTVDKFVFYHLVDGHELSEITFENAYAYLGTDKNGELFGYGNAPIKGKITTSYDDGRESTVKEGYDGEYRFGINGDDFTYYCWYFDVDSKTGEFKRQEDSGTMSISNFLGSILRQYDYWTARNVIQFLNVVFEQFPTFTEYANNDVATFLNNVIAKCKENLSGTSIDPFSEFFDITETDDGYIMTKKTGILTSAYSDIEILKADKFIEKYFGEKALSLIKKVPASLHETLGEIRAKLIGDGVTTNDLVALLDKGARLYSGDETATFKSLTNIDLAEKISQSKDSKLIDVIIEAIDDESIEKKEIENKIVGAITDMQSKTLNELFGESLDLTEAKEIAGLVEETIASCEYRFTKGGNGGKLTVEINPAKIFALAVGEDADKYYADENATSKIIFDFCSAPDYDDEAANGIFYGLSSDGTYYSVKGVWKVPQDGKVIIPESYNGKPIKTIDSSAFAMCFDVVNLVLPEGITEIGEGAFSGCISLLSITLPSTLTKIGDYAFRNCHKLVEIINNSKLNIEKQSNDNGGIGYNALYVHNGNSKIVNKDGYLFITDEQGVNYLLGYKGSKGNLILPEDYGGSSYEIYNFAFYDCIYCTDVTLGSGVTNIGYYAFTHCLKLKNIHYTGDVNDWVQTEGLASGGLMSDFRSERRTLYINNQLPTTINIDIAKKINACAFCFCESLTNVTIGDSVTEIGDRVFYGCSSLTNVVVGNNVVNIGNSAFGDLDLFKFNEFDNAYYLGNESNPYVVLIKAKSTDITGCSVSEKCKVIYENAFKGCEVLTNIMIPNSVTCIGKYAFSECELLKNITIPSGVTKISDGAFYGCCSLVSVNIPNSVTSIGSSAFECCNVLECVTLGGGVTSIAYNSFQYCCKLVEVINKSSLEITKGSENNGYIGRYALYVHNGASKIEKEGNYSFITGENGIKYLLDYTGSEKNVTLPNNGEEYEIYYSAFEGCDILVSVIIPDCVTKIGDHAFSYCSNLMTITIGSGVTEIGSDVFSGSVKLAEIINKSNIGTWASGCLIDHRGDSLIVPESGFYFMIVNGTNYLLGATENITGSTLTLPDNYNDEKYVIHDYAFNNCKFLTSVTIPNSVTSIGKYAFYGCDSLENIYYNGSVDDWCQINGLSNLMSYGKTEKKLFIKNVLLTKADMNSTTTISKSAFYGCSSLASVTIGNSVINIGDYAFYGCSLLQYNEFDNAYYLGNETNKYLWLIKAKSTDITDCTINENCKHIMNGAFADCHSLTNIIIPDSVITIGESAFYHCVELTTITIPDSVTSLGSGAFYGCYNLWSVSLGKGITCIEYDTFRDCYCLVYVTIPKSVTNIENAFGAGNFQLTVYYEGTESEWKQIFIHDSIIEDRALIEYKGEVE